MQCTVVKDVTLYVKEIVKGESYVELAEEEAEALDKAIFHDIEKIEKSEIIEKKGGYERC